MDIKTLINKCVRILYISRKPTREEFMEVAKITSMGMVAIGLIGLIISLVLKI
ncbi:protein translocase SEC61 complex subunit gamma [Candidatus Micrarchaeota archaeon]|nr:protein translocase SEC61 complex subunit gamma [Candidatus Micrarchaeota archaeon]